MAACLKNSSVAIRRTRLLLDHRRTGGAHRDVPGTSAKRFGLISFIARGEFLFGLQRTSPAGSI